MIGMLGPMLLKSIEDEHLIGIVGQGLVTIGGPRRLIHKGWQLGEPAFSGHRIPDQQDIGLGGTKVENAVVQTFEKSDGIEPTVSNLARYGIDVHKTIEAGDMHASHGGNEDYGSSREF